MKTLLSFEWKLFLRNRIFLLGIGLVFFAGIYAIYYGNTEIIRQKATISSVQKADLERVAKQKADFKEPNFEASWRMSRVITNIPSSLAALSLGQRDVFPYYKSVRTYGLYSGIFSSEIANPLKLLTGNFDLAFVFIFLLPLLIIALSFNVLSSEKEQGTLSLILSNQISLKRLIGTKMLFRFLLVLALVTLLFLLGIIWTGTGLNSYAISWFASTCLYIAFWFSVAFWVVSLQKNTSFNALSLLAAWLVFVLVIPTLINLYLESSQPISSGATLQRELREIPEKGWNVPRKETISNFFTKYPNKKVDTTKVDANMVFEIAAIQGMDDISKPAFGTYKQELQNRINLSRNLSWLSPAAQTQSMMNQLADSDTDNYLNYLNNLETYYHQLKGFFDDMKLANKKFGKSDFDSIPKPEISINKISFSWIQILPVLLFGLVFLGLGWLNIKKRFV